MQTARKQQAEQWVEHRRQREEEECRQRVTVITEFDAGDPDATMHAMCSLLASVSEDHVRRQFGAMLVELNAHACLVSSTSLSKREIVGLRNERDFPYLVELALPPGGFRGVLNTGGPLRGV